MPHPFTPVFYVLLAAARAASFAAPFARASCTCATARYAAPKDFSFTISCSAATSTVFSSCARRPRYSPPYPSAATTPRAVATRPEGDPEAEDKEDDEADADDADEETPVVCMRTLARMAGYVSAVASALEAAPSRKASPAESSGRAAPRAASRRRRAWSNAVNCARKKGGAKGGVKGCGRGVFRARGGACLQGGVAGEQKGHPERAVETGARALRCRRGRIRARVRSSARRRRRGRGRRHNLARRAARRCAVAVATAAAGRDGAAARHLRGARKHTPRTSQPGSSGDTRVRAASARAAAPLRSGVPGAWWPACPAAP
jgi:hypothetical protein